MANRSTFVAPLYTIDQFLELSQLPPERDQDAERLQVLMKKVNKTPEEITEMNSLMTLLQSYFISTETWNKFCDVLINVEQKVKDEIDTVNTAVTTGVESVNTSKDAALNAIELKKNNVIEYLDGTTAGVLRNDIGVMGDLTTTDKTSLVKAINEVKSSTSVTASDVSTSDGGNVQDKINVLCSDLDTLESNVASHKADDTSHITSGERNAWNGKQDALAVENRRKITFGIANPTGGSDGDIYLQYV